MFGDIWDKRVSINKQSNLWPLFSTVQVWCSDGQLLFLLFLLHLLSLALGQSGCSWSGSQAVMVPWHHGTQLLPEKLGINGNEVQVITSYAVSVA